jgi:hypothetical protein
MCGDEEGTNGDTKVFISASSLSKLVSDFLESKSKDRARMKGLDDDRKDQILAGALLVNRLFQLLDIKRMQVCSSALREGLHEMGEGHRGYGDRGLIALVNEQRLRRILNRLLDEDEFLSPYGIRALSRFHARHPYVFHVDGADYRVDYLPAESDSGMFGGNSNWRGPIWMPMNVLIIRALLQFYLYYGDSFTIECPIGSGRSMHLFDVAKELTTRITRIFLRDEHGHRPVFGGSTIFQDDPHWRDHLLFYEYFHGDNGAGLGANHQTGWTGLVAKMIELYGRLDPQMLLKEGKRSAHAGGKAGK